MAQVGKPAHASVLVNIAMTRLYARALRGERALLHRPDKRGKNVTIVGAIALRGIVGAMTFKGGTDTLAFQTYIKEVLVPNMTVRSLCGYG